MFDLSSFYSIQLLSFVTQKFLATVKDGGKSLLRKSGKFQRVGAHLGMQRMLVEKLVFNMIIASENHLW